MQKIVMFNQKGGVGKTMSAANIAGCIAKKRNERVLLIDCDSQCNLTNYMMKVQPDDFERKNNTLISYMTDGISADDVIEPVFVEKGNSYDVVQLPIDIIPGDPRMFQVVIDDDSIFRELFAELDDRYDICIIDVPPNMTGVTFKVLEAADYVLVPAEPDEFSLQGYSAIIDLVQGIRENSNVGLEILGLFVNKMQNKTVEKFTFKQMKDGLGSTLFKTQIRYSVEIKNAMQMEKTLPYYNTSLGITHDYYNLTDEIYRRMKKK